MEYPVIDAKATGARIKELRKARRLKVDEIARFMGFESEQAIYKWQRGDSLPTIDNLYALSRLFETSVDDILRGSREEDESPPLSLVCPPCACFLNRWFIFLKFDLYHNKFNERGLGRR